MSEERFDKLMRQNLKSVRPAYEPRAWERFEKRLPATGFLPWLSHYGGWLLSGLILTGWITTLYTLHEDRQVMRQLSRQLANLAQPTTGAAVVNKLIDTVYMVKQAVVIHRHVYDPSTPGLIPTQPAPAITNPAPPGTSPTRNIVTATDSINSINKPIADATAIQPAKPAQADSASTEPTQPATLQLDLTTSKPAATPLPAAVSALASVAVAQPAKQSRPRFRLSSLQPRVGVETTAMWKGVGVGPAIELFPTENLGVSVGLQASQLQVGRHHDLRDFNSATGQEFLEQYRSYLPTQYDQIRDISVQTSLVSVPVMLNYYVPIRKRWALLFRTGTSFDVAAYQQISYESLWRGDDQSHSFEIDSEPHVFHNFMFSAGVQYRRSHLSAQLSPYYLYDFRSLPNTPAGSNVGIRASVWLNLFK